MSRDVDRIIRAVEEDDRIPPVHRRVLINRIEMYPNQAELDLARAQVYPDLASRSATEPAAVGPVTPEMRAAFLAESEQTCDQVGCGRPDCLDVRLAAALAVAERGIQARIARAVAEVRTALTRFGTEPYGDLAANADRVAVVAVAALRDAGLLTPLDKATPDLCYGLDVPHARGLHPDLCQGCGAAAPSLPEGGDPRG